MFETLEFGERRGFVRRACSLLVSLLFHVVGIGALVLVPLLWLSIIPDVALLTYLFAVPSPPPADKPPLPPVGPVQAYGNSGTVSLGRFTPRAIPDGISLDPPPPEELPAVGFGVAGQPFGPAGLAGVPLELLPGARPVATPLPPPPPPVRRPAEPLRIGGNVLESRLVRKVEPAYPDLARRARVSGEVALEVTVDAEGAVAAVRILSGHPLLNNAAVEAVRQWKYSPTLLNGEPVPVFAIVTVIFTLS